MGIEPTLSAWKAEVLPLNYTRATPSLRLVEGEGFEPSKAEPADLQSAPFNRSGTPPKQEIKSQKSRINPNRAYAKPEFFHNWTGKSTV